jgi:hypothetical protein
MKMDPTLANIRSDARHVPLLEKMGLGTNRAGARAPGRCKQR